MSYVCAAGGLACDMKATRYVRHHLIAVATMGCCLLLQHALHAQGEKALSLRGNAVRVSSGDGDAENGFGFIVSEKDGKVYLVTANHVVSAVNMPDQPPPTIRVFYFTDQAKSYAAELLEHQTDHDLALLRADRPPGFSWEKQCLAPSDEQTRGTAVWFIGRDASWYVPAANGLIASERPNAGQWLDIDIPGLRPGSSGGPVVTTAGILGMVKARTVDDTRVLSVEFIRQAVEGWGYLWQLTSAPPSYDGEWQGTLQYSLPLVFRLRGNGTGTSDSPSQNAYAMPLEYVVEQDKVIMRVPSVGASYTAVANNAEMNGTFTQSGASLPLRLSLQTQGTPNRTALTTIEGNWRGELEYNLPLVFHLNANGTGTSDSPAQERYAMPVEYTTDGTTIVIRVPSVGASYTAVATDAEMNGTFTQHGANLPLRLAKRTTR